MTPKTYEIMTCAADAFGNTLFIIVDGDTGLSVDLNVGYDTYAEAYEALQDLEDEDDRVADAEREFDAGERERLANEDDYDDCHTGRGA